MYIKSFKKLATYLLTISMILFSFSSVFASSTTVLTAPTSFVATAGDSQINLNWSEVPGATYYNVFESLDDLTYNLISVPATVTTSAYDVTGLTNGKMYYFKISAANIATESTFSKVARETPVVKTAPVNLGAAGKYAMLAKSGISSVPQSFITGDIGVSPITSTAMTGFSLTVDATNQFSSSTQVNGKAYAPDYASPTASNLTTAVSNMQTAYIDAAGRPSNYTELYTGDISGKTLTAGVYKWGTGVLINGDVTLSGGANDVWIFQIAKGITQAAGAKIILAGGAQAKNIFWQAAGSVSIGADAHFEGIILGKTNIAVGTHASINGRLLAQTAVTLIMNTVVAPAETTVDVSDVANLTEFKAALANTAIKTINVISSFETTEKIIVSRPVTINGGSKMIKFTGDVAGWQGNYVIEVYNTKGVNIDDIKLIGGDAALLVNGSDVTLTGRIDVSGNEYGGIEVSKGTVADLQNSTLTVTETGTLVNVTEAYSLPTIWLARGQGTVKGVNAPVTTSLTIKTYQTQYYLVDTNAVAL
ncbi:ice-binding family protein [Clostridium sp. CF012]|uniref:ice-binding family protein n=1 Tax=Clostridium sp. CF012 TaxID=2843319 RepID=UPI001C0CB9A5|nr:ice-binding family protein [Clostridium sp. CF012]MBU3146283.1 DUF3494 domain-containing protein [Clostridium sp. CF012]